MPFLSDDSTAAAGFPHSETCGSKVTCTSPQLFAAYRVLLRLIWPRHPPYALTYLTYAGLILPYLPHLGSILGSLQFSFQKRGLFQYMQLSRYEYIERFDGLSKLNNAVVCASCRPKDWKTILCVAFRLLQNWLSA